MGTVLAGTGSVVDLQNGVTISGGTLSTSGTGLIHTIGGNTSTLENLTNSGAYQVDNNATTVVVGTITNNGNINLASGGNTTELQLNGNVTLTGTGTVTMSNNSNNVIVGAAPGNTLTNSETIQGSGNIGGGSMALVNSGTIDATQSSVLYIDTSNGTTNTGTLEATTGTLVLYGNTVTQTGAGKIVSSGSDVQLQNGVTIVGGTLSTSGSGLIHSIGGQSATLQNLTNAGNYQVDNNSVTNLVGTITNNGNINLASGGGVTDLVLSTGNVTLNGTGTLTMSNNPNNFIFGAAGTDTLTVGSGQTISGAGNIGGDPNIGAGQMALVNNGIIDATQSNALTIQTSNGTTNTKTIEASGGGTLILYGSTVAQTGVGTITAANGSVVDLQNGVTINGGTLATCRNRLDPHPGGLDLDAGKPDQQRQLSG